jgi:hypothetical protein
MESGGGAFHYIPCLNDDDEHARSLARVILSQGKLSSVIDNRYDQKTGTD